jgi:hypothetical protein
VIFDIQNEIEGDVGVNTDNFSHATNSVISSSLAIRFSKATDAFSLPCLGMPPIYISPFHIAGIISPCPNVPVCPLGTLYVLAVVSFVDNEDRPASFP